MPATISRPELSDVDYRSLIESFGEQYRSRVEAQRRYPPIALQRGLQGTVMLLARFAPGGSLSQVEVERSCGEDVLDRDARQLVAAVEPPPVPRALAERAFALHVPVVYRLR